MRHQHWLPIALFAAGGIFTASCASMSATGETDGNGGTGGAGGNGATGAGTGASEGGFDKKSQGPAGGTGASAPDMTGGAGGGGVGGAGGGAGTGASSGTGLVETCADPGTPRTFYMSSDDSSSMGSPALAREFLLAGKAPPTALLRTYEFLNYYHVRYPVPTNDRLAVHAHFASAPDGTYRLQVGVQAHDVERPRMALTFVVDTSGSLVGEGINRERAAIQAISKKLVAGDRVNFVTWANEDSVVLANHEVTGPSDPKLAAAIATLVAGGGSDLHAGLTLGYDLAAQTNADDRLSRVILISDGGANLGVLDRDRIAAEALQGDDKGIYLVGIGVGPAFGYSDALMNLVTDKGRGSYVYLDSVAEAESMLAGRFEEVMDIAARSVRVAVTLPSYFEIKDFYGEEYSEDPAIIEPQHLAPRDSMIFNQTVSVCADCAVCNTDPITVHVEWQDPFLHASSSENVADGSFALQGLEGDAWQLLKAEAIVAYAGALASRKKGDLVKATAALTAAKTAVDTAAKDPAIEDDEFKDELDDIAALLASFPEGEMVD